MKKGKANAIGGAVFLIGLGILFLSKWWWPGIIVVIGASGAVTSLIKGNLRHALVTIVIFGVIFALFMTEISTSVIIALLLIGVGVWVVLNSILS